MRDQVAKLQHGNRELGLQKITGKNRNPQTLRRAISALEFLERLSKEARYSSALKLEAYPVAAIEYLSRWYKRDASGALRAADKLLRGDYDVKSLQTAESNSRKNIFEGAGKALETDYRLKVSEKIAEIVRTAAGPSLESFKSNELGDPAAIPDFAYRNAQGIFVVGVLICGPYRDPDLYRRRAFEWVSKAYTLLNLFELIFLVLPDNANLHLFKNLVRQLNIGEHRLRIVKINSSQK
ncbi:MAG: hypothetical protein HYX37_07790 [Rhizobiales bacterium]|nr:hypothetical protein [Hyphomicrobiales bacterium]